MSENQEVKKLEFKSDARLRVWLALLWKDNLKENWRQILDSYCICCAISPLHDQDVFDTDYDDGVYSHKAGELKKPHYHVVFKFSGSKSFRQVWDLINELHSDGRGSPPEKPKTDTDHAVRYLIHYDHKDKVQYNRSEIIALGGFDVDRYFRINSEQLDNLVCTLMDYCESRKINQYYILLKSLRQDRFDNVIFDELFRFSYSHSNFCIQYLTSKRFYYQDQKEKEENKDE